VAWDFISAIYESEYNMIIADSNSNSFRNKVLAKCYNLRLGSGCNLGKDLRKNRDEVQLVKCKEYRVVSTLYIQVVHEASVWST